KKRRRSLTFTCGPRHREYPRGHNGQTGALVSCGRRWVKAPARIDPAFMRLIRTYGRTRAVIEWLSVTCGGKSAERESRRRRPLRAYGRAAARLISAYFTTLFAQGRGDQV